MKIEQLVTALFILPVVASGIQLLFRSSKQIITFTMQISFSSLQLVFVLLLFFNHQELTIINVASWPAPYGITLVVDNLDKLILLVVSLLFFCINLYGSQDSSLGSYKNNFYAASWILVLGAIGALLTHDIFNLYVWAEVILVSAFIILRTSVLNNTVSMYHYAVFNILGTLMMLLAIGIIYGATGDLNYSAVANNILTQSNPTAWFGVSLFLVGLLVKGAIFPFCFWLSNAYPDTSASSTLILSSFVTKIIMIVLLRLCWLWQIPQLSTITLILLFCAAGSMIFGVMGAANNYNIRSILSFHIISQLGYILMAIFMPSVVAIIAVLFFLIHNMFVKTCLLMTSGIVEQQYQTDDLHNLGRMTQACPILAGLFFISAMSLAGIPPLSGFWAKLFVFKAAYNQQHYIMLFIAILVSLFTLFSMIKIWRFAYCETPSEDNSNQNSFRLTGIQLMAILPLSLIPLIIGLYPMSLLPILESIASQLRDSSHLIHLVLGQSL